MAKQSTTASFAPFRISESPSEIQESQYLTMRHGKATDALSRVQKADLVQNPITHTYSANYAEMIIAFDELPEVLGIQNHKLLSIAVARFTATNDSRANAKHFDPQHCRVTIPFRQYASNLGYDVTERPEAEDPEKEKRRVKNALNEAQKRIRRELDALQASRLTWEETRHGKTVAYRSVSIIGAYSIDVRGDVITIEFTVSMSQYLLSLPSTQYPIALLRVDARRPNAYRMGLKIAEHYNQDSHIARNSNTRLQVQTLLAATDLPSIDNVRAAGRSWQERIWEPFEKSLFHLKEIGLLQDFEYVGPKGTALKHDEVEALTYDQWQALYVEFSLKDPPDHSERMENKRERQKKAAAAARRKKAAAAKAKEEKAAKAAPAKITDEQIDRQNKTVLPQRID